MNKDIKVLVVDDEELIRNLVRIILEREGFKHIIETEDGVSAFEILKTEKIDLIISDWDMPQMTGIELLINVRAEKAIAQVPFIMLSSESFDDNMDQAFKNGVDDFVSKPFRVYDLVTSIKQVMKDMVR